MPSLLREVVASAIGASGLNAVRRGTLAVWMALLSVIVTSCGPADVPGATYTAAPPQSQVAAAASATIPPGETDILAYPNVQPPLAPQTPTAFPTEQATATQLAISPGAAPATEPISSPTLTSTSTPDSGTAAPIASITPSATAGTTAPSPIPATTNTRVPPPPGEVVQPPYEASPCSDSYPCNDDVQGWEARVRVPQGFEDRYFARLNGNPTSIAFGPDGQLYVATMQGTIARIDDNGNATVYVGGLNTPTGIAFRPGTSDLYVSSRVRNEVIGGEAQVSLVQGGSIRQLFGGLPCCYAGMHAANGIAFGPDGMGYVGVGGRADHGELLDGSMQQDTPHALEASILRFTPDGTSVEAFAKGFRNPYDIAWDANGQLYATDNAPDYGPPEELHRVVPGGQHGYPWFDCDVCFKPPPEVQIIPPIYTFVPHGSPTGITVYLANQFPGYYNSIFLTLWSAFPGAQKVVKLGPGGVAATNFAMGFAQPIDITVGPEGSLYVADFATGIIFRISYTG